MNELRIFHDLGLELHMHVVAAVLLFSVVVKILYQSHLKSFFKDVFQFLQRVLDRRRENAPPSLYDMMPVKFRGWLDITQMCWAYSVVLVCLYYELMIIYWATKPDFWQMPLHQLLIVAGAFCLFLLFKFTALKVGNRILHQKLTSDDDES